LSELDALKGAELSRVKAFMSRQVDRIRPPYGKRVIDLPRECVFAGTVNKDTYLTDETGGRRFWPVKCGPINTPDLERDRDQLWAEAVERFRAGGSWWLDSQALRRSAAQEVAERHEPDAWDELITEWVKAPKERLVRPAIQSPRRSRLPTS
jgi:predicted P-loop ATPase